MRWMVPVAALVLNACATSPSPEIDELTGKWAVALYFDAGAPPSATDMVITTASEGKLAGTFYGSPFEAGNYAIREGIVAIAALTSDQSGVYAHSARLVNGRLEGQTLSQGRNFLMTWTATRTE